MNCNCVQASSINLSPHDCQAYSYGGSLGLIHGANFYNLLLRLRRERPHSLSSYEYEAEYARLVMSDPKLCLTSSRLQWSIDCKAMWLMPKPTDRTTPNERQKAAAGHATMLWMSPAAMFNNDVHLQHLWHAILHAASLTSRICLEIPQTRHDGSRAEKPR